ncbi:MAG: GGDEF domain-containing phosphodiesterase [Treponema sp.]|jgi:EAL domain-containing protein (putative c-di-GMP-specific phosphodiesterase class I)/GGDEF domain-containing protein|nr:GGDEF domain-containing phosphodiesterase [Treponema sp.]
MNVWNLDFDIAGIIVGTAILIIYKANRNLRTWQNNIFQLLVITFLFSCFFEILFCFSLIFWTPHYTIPVFIITILSLYTTNTLPVLYYFFVIAMVTDRKDISLGRKLAAVIPFAVTSVLVWFAAFDAVHFYLSPASPCRHRIFIFALFAAAFYYVLSTLIVTIKYSTRLTMKQRSVPIVCTVVLVFVFLYIFYFPEYLLVNFAISVCLIFIFMTLQNPLEFKDAATNIYSSRAFSKIVREKIGRREIFSILSIKLSGLAVINERLGIEQGNLLISEFADYLLRISRKNIEAFHLSGVEFSLIISSRPSSGDIKLTEQRIQQRFRQPFLCGSIQVTLNGYICQYDFPRDFSDTKELLDIISYVFDSAGKLKADDTIYTKQKIEKQQQHDMAVKFAIQNSIENRSFQVYFQPIQSVKTGKFTCAEALVRMTSPELGLIPPDDFIPKAEKTGQIIKIGEIVLEKCCRCLVENNLQDSGITVLNVNLSVVQCLQQNLVESLMSIIDSYHIPHHMIDFEITESIAVTTNSVFEENFVRLKENGFSISLDDFGTGYSNITKVINNCSYDVIKIDKSIVWAADKNRKGEIILRNIIAAFKELGTTILAEGIETPEQADRLKKLGCDYFQGYLFSKPLPETEFVKFLQTQTAAEILPV